MNEANFPARWNEELLAECQRIARIGGWICDLTGRITWADETYRVFAVDPATFTANLESFLQLIHPGDRSAVQAWTAACLAGEKPGELTFRRILPDGSIRLIRGRGELKYDAENRPSHMTGALQDITEQERTEQRLRDSEMRARLLVESAPEAIFVQTGGCFVLRDNQAELNKAQQIAGVGSWKWHIPSNRLSWSEEMYRIFGIDPQRFTGDLAEVIASAIHPEDRDAVEQANRAVLQERMAKPLEYRMIWPDGTVRTAEARAPSFESRSPPLWMACDFNPRFDGDFCPDEEPIPF